MVTGSINKYIIIGIMHRPTVTFRASWQQLYWSLHQFFKLTISYKKRHKNYINLRGSDSSMAGCCRTSSRSLISICLLLQLPCSKFKLSVGLWQKKTNANYWISTCFSITCYSWIISSKINRIVGGIFVANMAPRLFRRKETHLKFSGEMGVTTFRDFPVDLRLFEVHSILRGIL